MASDGELVRKVLAGIDLVAGDDKKLTHANADVRIVAQQNARK